MNILKNFIAFILLILFITSYCSNDNRKNKHRKLDYSTKIVFTDDKNNKISTLNAALALSNNERNIGLMNVLDMPKDNGMLFVFEKEDILSFWMKNTPLPLDIIYIDKNKTIIKIHHRTTPYSQKSYSSEKFAKYVIETNAHYCKNNNIKVGDKVQFNLIN